MASSIRCCDSGQVELPGGQLAVVGQALHLRGELAAFFDPLMDLFLDPGQPGPQIVAAGVEMRGGRTFKMLPQVGLRGPRADGCGQIALDVLVFVAQVLDPGGLGRQAVQMLFAFGPALPQQLLAALLQPGDGLLALGPRAAELAQTAADHVAAGDAGLLPREHLGKLQDLLHGMLRLDLDAAIGHQLGHAAVEHVALAAALAKFFVQKRKAGLHVADVAGQARHLADIARARNSAASRPFPGPRARPAGRCEGPLRPGPRGGPSRPRLAGPPRAGNPAGPGLPRPPIPARPRPGGWPSARRRWGSWSSSTARSSLVCLICICSSRNWFWPSSSC